MGTVKKVELCDRAKSLEMRTKYGNFSISQIGGFSKFEIFNGGNGQEG